MGLAQQVTNMQKIYISLPITGLDINKCRERADKVKAALSRKGYNPVSPFDIYAGKNATYKDYICNDLRVLMECDAPRGDYCCCRGRSIPISQRTKGLRNNEYNANSRKIFCA